MPNQPPTRLPRFTRAASSPGIALTERDLAILHRVARHRFLTSRQIVRLVGRSPQPVLRRLQRLFHHGYLDRPRAQIDYFHRGGSQPLVYGLGRRSLPVLFPEGDTRPRVDNLNVGRLHLQHTVLIAEVLIGIELACAHRADARFVPEAELRKDGSFRWSIMVHHRGASRRVGLVPDAVFALERRGGKRAFYFLEADRGTMPVQRDSLSQSSFFRKLLAYAATWNQELHRRKFGLHRFRVLTVTPSPLRAKHLAEAAAQLTSGQGLFLFGAAHSLSADNLLACEWITGRIGVTSPLWDSN